jgi:hypothetical protein
MWDLVRESLMIIYQRMTLHIISKCLPSAITQTYHISKDGIDFHVRSSLVLKNVEFLQRWRLECRSNINWSTCRPTHIITSMDVSRYP